MKNKLKIAVLLMLCTLLLVACGVPGGGEACQHRDADDNALCDKCSVSYTDGKDIPDAPACQHRDANDDDKCDECAEPYTDGKDIPDAPACQHRDANDDGKCDECAEPYTDGKDIPDAPACQHRDANDDEKCDNCGEDYTDGKDIPDAPACQHRDADDDEKCDECGEAFEDGKDIPDLPEENHVDADLDHACDCGCGTRFGTHWDTDKNHVCDYGCKELLFVHDDLDKDHACDYCAGNIGECLDADKNHACDYGCAKTFGMHLDENLDHTCDYGCTLTFGAHLDENKDHKCDYGCAEVIGEHNANNLDSTCDYCGEIFAHDCVDTDKTHLCDICGAVIGECADVNADHLCDYCTKQLTDCEDANKNHACDICGAAMGVCMDANKDHLCDYGCVISFGVHEDSNCDHYCEYCACYDFDFGAHEDRDFNHYCDYGCSELIGVCEDSDFDHQCDHGCEYYYGEHADTDKNGACDYCKIEMDHECVDEDLNHWCDYGCRDSYFGECTDKDQDSKCDYGCDRHYCWDQDEDSYCDFGCGRHFCYDNDHDHFCDFNCGNSWAWEQHHPSEENHFCLYCGERLTECYDVDPRDHICDICVMWFGECVDENGDHLCDICGFLLSECVDEYPADHFCDVCGFCLGACFDDNRDHLCDVCSIVLGECFDDDYDHYCDICSAIMSECINENFDHNCDICGQILVPNCFDEYPLDHKCDICGVYMGVHEDLLLNGEFDAYGNPIYGKDHKCDWGCDVPFGICEDTDRDHYCDVYGKACANVLFGICEDADKNGFCDHGCGKTFEIIPDPLYVRDGDYIYFGEYPQTIKADDVMITEAQDSRGYFLGSDGCYYAMVTATPNDSNYTFSTGATVSDGEVYYFKVELIRWRILEEKNGMALILCDSIIANMMYNEAHSNNYKDSDIRAWLNVQFYETAFGDLQKRIISSYACENTENKVFLLSYEEVTNRAYGFASNYGTSDIARRMITSDYARASGAYTNMSTSSSYYGNGFWWLRTSYDSHSSYARVVYNDGYAGVLDYVFFSDRGVVPALQILLVGDCDDADMNHSCDTCGAVTSFHADENKDHACDAYGADCALFADIPAHIDENVKDHLCDAYGTECALGKFGDHADTDFNHNCDYGCLISFGICEDADSNGYCDHGCGKQFEIESDAPLYTRDGDYIYFGEYPQTIKADDVTITETQDSRGYFLGSDGCYYAMVTATPKGSNYTFSTGETVSNGEVYYFKVEPIRWRILEEKNGTALILCDSIIANMAYDAEGSNNYKDSDVRAWLNTQFYRTAFGGLEQKIILMTMVDNSAESTGHSSNTFVCEDTEDKIFLLSYKEASSVYGITTSNNRHLLTSDYVRAMGSYMSTSNYDYGYNHWLLRSPYVYFSTGVRFVPYNGITNKYVPASNSFHGIVPALWIRL